MVSDYQTQDYHKVTVPVKEKLSDLFAAGQRGDCWDWLRRRGMG
jgi:hypothetical protein